MSESTKVGFIGLGNMGAPMAANVAHSGFDLIVRDTDQNLASKIAYASGAVAASSPSDFAEVEIVVTMLPTSTIVSQALFDWGDGVVHHLAPDAVIVDMSSSDPTQTKELGKILKGHGIALIDAPVSGGVSKATTGELSIMLGCDNAEAIAKALPIVESMSSVIFRTGDLGSGHAMKALNNFVAAAATTAACEALVIGDRFGLDQHTILNVLNSSTGRSWVTENVLGPHVVDREYGSGFSLALYSKDVGIAKNLAAAVDDPAPVCTAVAGTMTNALSTLGNVDHTEAITFWEQERITRGT
ncbi:NAD(P)-dependent oxidoreductase [Brevibacterium sp. UCMA 11752]|uniref:NAD(P)-dependent oxidoreductase n=1 Tax=Brevibacterium sp. UCMA 11752 TaxID=2745946 RepID=UPI001F298859|nr:NAD(P)-dependent oxidoreductase [Brevibacterium sp. UCMA 11752]MCF2588674.1 NAD(P)-dependent oxidoreductase [Brevibacterium sp. UCMA 11752]